MLELYMVTKSIYNRENSIHQIHIKKISTQIQKINSPKNTDKDNHPYTPKLQQYLQQYLTQKKTMSDVFKSYQQQLIISLTQINKKIQSINVQTNQKKQMAFVDIKEDHKQCQKLLKMMQTEVNTLDVQIKFQFSKKVRQYKKDLDDSKKKLFKAEEEFAFEKNKEMLIGAQLDEEKSTVNRQKLLKQGEMLSDTNYKLKDSVRVMRQTQQISNNVQIQLVNQSKKMKDNKQKLLEMQDDIGSSAKIIKSISLRIKRHKMVLFGVIGLILLIGIIALIVHFSKK